MTQFLPRGVRLNNPANIRHSAEVWQGQSMQQSDKDFVSFKTMAYGVRAAAKVIHTYMAQYGLHTVRQIILRWAPPSENNTMAYIEDVAHRMGLTPDHTLTSGNLQALLKAIFHHENGGDYVSDHDLEAGIALLADSH